MAVYHDAYLCDLEKLHNVAATIDRALNSSPPNLALLQERALQVLDENSIAIKASDRYGSWARSDIARINIEQLDSDDLALLVLSLIYSIFFAEIPGLGNRWKELEQLLEKLHWNAEDIQFLIRGETVGNLLQKTTYRSQNSMPQYWSDMNPYSTASSMGFITVEEARRLHKMLAGQLQDLESQLPASVLETAVNMLKPCIENSALLCVILSG